MYFIPPVILIILMMIIITSVILKSDNAPMLLFLVVIGPVLYLYLNSKIYYTQPPKLINKSTVSVMHDKYVAIVRVGDEYQETFTTKYEYDNILLGKFVVKKQNKYNIFGELNETDYIVTINK